MHKLYFTDSAIDEAVFVPRDDATDALDGYYLTFDNSIDAAHCRLLVRDAACFPGDPIARVLMPRPLP